MKKYLISFIVLGLVLIGFLFWLFQNDSSESMVITNEKQQQIGGEKIIYLTETIIEIDSREFSSVNKNNIYFADFDGSDRKLFNTGNDLEVQIYVIL